MIELHSVEKYDRALIRAALAAALAPAGGFAGLLADRKRIVLKPNFVVPERADRCATTHPDVYMTVATMLLELGNSVTIADSPAFGTTGQAIKLHRVQDECRDLGIDVLTFRQPQAFDGLADQSRYKTLTIAGELDNFDALINLPKLKVHQQFVVSGATKNLYGCVTGNRKFFRHNVCVNDPVRFAHMIVANARRAAPVLNIADGIMAMHVKGPRGGDSYPLQYLIVSDDFLTLDWLFCRLIDQDPMATPLFEALGAAACERLAADCSAVLAGAAFEVAPEFMPSYRTDISFRPQHILRSAWRSLMFRLHRA